MGQRSEMEPVHLDIGATPVAGGVLFRVWAPAAGAVSVELVGCAQKIPLRREGEYFQGVIPAVPGDRYWYWLDGTTRRPDPASRCQPDGVHGPSQVVDPLHTWSDSAWHGIPLKECIFYEMHIGTFTPEGTFDAAAKRLDHLKELGITAVELMPVAQFPGAHNWGYDGVFPFAPQLSYGGIAGLKRFVDTCHRQGLAVILDVVYNHLGPEGNYLHAFGPYFTDRYRTPWGDAVNFDGPQSDGVRHFFITNACHWVSEYHLDGLRLDAIQSIYNFSACHILTELADEVHRLAEALDRKAYVIAESDLNDVRVITSPESGGYGLDAQWNDDFHHALRALLTGDRAGYFCDYGSFSHLEKSFREGFVLSGQYSAFRKRRHGSSTAAIPPTRLVVFSQNHDQVGNRMRGERPGEHLSPDQLKLAAAIVLLSPYLPLLFMGEEYGEPAPFPYFIDHGDADLVEMVRQGRLEEFAPFANQGSPPDPQAETTFLSAKLDLDLRLQAGHRTMFDFYRELIRLRKEYLGAMHSREDLQVVACEEDRILALVRSTGDSQVLCLFNCSDQSRTIRPPLVSGTLRVLLDSTGNSTPGSSVTVANRLPESFPALAPFGVIVYRKE